MTEPTPSTPQPPPPPAGAPPPRPKPFVPKALPKVPRPPARPKFAAVGGTKGLIVWLLTAGSVAYFGWVAFAKYGQVFDRVFQRSVSTSYESRDAFLRSRFAEIENAGRDRRFGFFSPSIAPKALKVYFEGDAMVLDASDAKDSTEAVEAAKELDAFRSGAGDLAALKVRFPPPRDPAKVAQVAAFLFERVLDGAPDGVLPAGEIRWNDLPDAKR